MKKKSQKQMAQDSIIDLIAGYLVMLFFTCLFLAIAGF